MLLNQPSLTDQKTNPSATTSRAAVTGKTTAVSPATDVTGPNGSPAVVVLTTGISPNRLTSLVLTMMSQQMIAEQKTKPPAMINPPAATTRLVEISPATGVTATSLNGRPVPDPAATTATARVTGSSTWATAARATNSLR